LGRPFQTRGALRLQAAGPHAEVAVQALATANAEVWLSSLGRTRLHAVRRAGDGLALSFQGVYTPERARALVHAELWAPAESYPADAIADPSERFVGAPVLLDGAPYGRIERIIRGAQLLLVMRQAGDGREQLLPWGAPYLGWDGATLEIVDPPPGLLDLA
jgi:ribosomal 30S subunit maturation factor RimM